jgi:hypothetical protein
MGEIWGTRGVPPALEYVGHLVVTPHSYSPFSDTPSTANFSARIIGVSASLRCGRKVQDP